MIEDVDDIIEMLIIAQNNIIGNERAIVFTAGQIKRLLRVLSMLQAVDGSDVRIPNPEKGGRLE